MVDTTKWCCQGWNKIGMNAWNMKKRAETVKSPARFFYD